MIPHHDLYSILIPSPTLAWSALATDSRVRFHPALTSFTSLPSITSRKPLQDHKRFVLYNSGSAIGLQASPHHKRDHSVANKAWKPDHGLISQVPRNVKPSTSGLVSPLTRRSVVITGTGEPVTRMLVCCSLHGRRMTCNAKRPR